MTRGGSFKNFLLFPIFIEPPPPKFVLLVVRASLGLDRLQLLPVQHRHVHKSTGQTADEFEVKSSRRICEFYVCDQCRFTMM